MTRARTPASWRQAVDPAYSPDGRKLVFSSFNYGLGGDLHLVRADGRGRLRRLTRARPLREFEDGRDRSPAFAPDGRRLVYVNNRSQIRVYRAGRSRSIGSSGSGWEQVQPSWSVRGRIAFSSPGRIYTMRPDGSRRRRVVAGWDPDWSPDGRRIVYQIPGKAIIAIIRPNGRGRRVLTTDGVQPAFSPDGKHIVFVRPALFGPAGQRARDEIVVMRLRDRRTRTIADGATGRTGVRSRCSCPYHEFHYLHRPTWQPLRTAVGNALRSSPPSSPRLLVRRRCRRCPAHAAFPGRNGRIAFEHFQRVFPETAGPDSEYSRNSRCARMALGAAPCLAPTAMSEPAYSPSGRKLAVSAWLEPLLPSSRRRPRAAAAPDAADVRDRAT